MKANSFFWSHVRILYSNVRVVDNEVGFDLVLNAPKKILTRPVFDDVFKRLKAKAVDFGLDDININVSVIPKRVFRYQPEALFYASIIDSFRAALIKSELRSNN